MLITLQSLIEGVAGHRVEINSRFGRGYGKILHISFHAFNATIANPCYGQRVIDRGVVVQYGKKASVEIDLVGCGFQPFGGLFDCFAGEGGRDWEGFNWRFGSIVEPIICALFGGVGVGVGREMEVPILVVRSLGEFMIDGLGFHQGHQ